jgi:glycosyltransferase involved in cell wall biosynthesis
MQKPGKILLVSQHYPPDDTTTATYIGAIAHAVAAEAKVVVLSGSPHSRTNASANPQVVEIAGVGAPKEALFRRALAISLLALKMFVATLRRATASDVVFCVTTPFTLPYAVVLAARLRGAATVLLIYDLYPEALEAAGLIAPTSLAARLLRFANARMFRALDAIITIGRDVEPLLLAYKGVMREKIRFVPNWTLLPVGYRDVTPQNPFRAGHDGQFIAGLSGNLGFTHDPRAVLDAARLLQSERNIHFLLSGWGKGWRDLVAQVSDKPANISLREAVPQAELIDFLASAEIWVIPYRKRIAGVSVPSRLYNLLAVGRAIIIAAEPQSEAARVVEEEGIGWVVPPEDPAGLADAIRRAASDRDGTLAKGRRAALAAAKYAPDTALARYREIVLTVSNRERRPA